MRQMQNLNNEFNMATILGRRRLKDGGKKKRQSTWLISFTDVISLMLAFFVLLFSMKEPDQQSWSHVASVLMAEKNKYYGASMEQGFSTQDRATVVEKSEKTFGLNYLEALFKQYLDRKTFTQPPRFDRYQDRLVLSWDYTALNAALADDSSGLRALGDSLARIQNRLEIIAKPGVGDGVMKMLEAGQGIARIVKESGYSRDIVITGTSISRQMAFLPSDLAGGFDENRIFLVIYDY